MHSHMITDTKDALDFIFGGNARFTLVSKITGRRYTYKVRLTDVTDKPIAFVSVLTGPDNTSDYHYIGFVRPGGDVTAGAKGQPNHPAFKAISWAVRRFNRGQESAALEFWHEGRCARCARPLTDPASIERGFGPECVRHMEGV